MSSLLTTVLKFVGKNLAAGAVSFVGGSVMGSVLKLLSGDKPVRDQYGPAISRLGEQLTGISNLMRTNNARLLDELGQVEAQLREIHQEELYQSWQALHSDVEQYVARIHVQYDRYITYARNPAEVGPTQLSALTTDILNTNVGAAVQLRAINALVLESGSEKGLMTLWADMVLPLVRDGRISYKTAEDNYLAYYNWIVSAQICAELLLIEAWIHGDKTHIAEESWRTYRSLVTAQERTVVANFVKFPLYAIQPGASFKAHGTLGGDGYLLANMDYFSGIQEHSAGAIQGAYEPSSGPQQVEDLLAAAQAMGPDERSLVVWMIYPGLTKAHYPRLNYGELEIQLERVDQNADARVNATRSAILEMGPKCHVKRFVFTTDISDGSYRLFDMNGKNGLVPVDGSINRTVRFQDPECLSWRMNVDVEHRAGFMNFAAYPDSAVAYLKGVVIGVPFIPSGTPLHPEESRRRSQGLIEETREPSPS